MFKKLFTTASIVTITLFLLPACAEQGDDPEMAAGDNQATGASGSTSVSQRAPGGHSAVMNLPVNLSTQKEVDKSIEKVRQQAGDAEADNLERALGVILPQHMSQRQEKVALLKALNGKTPNEIIAMAKG